MYASRDVPVGDGEGKGKERDELPVVLMHNGGHFTVPIVHRLFLPLTAEDLPLRQIEFQQRHLTLEKSTNRVDRSFSL